MSNKTQNQGNELENVGEILSKSEKFIEKNQKRILIGVGIIVLIVVGFLGIRHGYIIPKEKEAAKEIFRGEQYFANGEWDKALFGDSVQYKGFEKIIDQYGITKTGKLAKAYAGICYYHKGQPEKALEYLKKFSPDDKMLNPAIVGLIGDCYVDLGKTNEGVDYFLKAAKKADNNLLSPIYLKKAGLSYESLKEYKKAFEVYTSIKEKYPKSMEASDIDKYIDRAQFLQK